MKRFAFLPFLIVSLAGGAILIALLVFLVAHLVPALPAVLALDRQEDVHRRRVAGADQLLTACPHQRAGHVCQAGKP